MEQQFHKTNKILWIGILCGMIILSGIIFYLDSYLFIKPHKDQKMISDIVFLLALIFAIAIFIFKRSFFQPMKLVSGLGKDKTTAVMLSIRRRYMIIWALAELILLLGFIQYILTANFNQFIILGIVSFYSIFINKPQEKLFEICKEYLSDNSDQYDSN